MSPFAKSVLLTAAALVPMLTAGCSRPATTPRAEAAPPMLGAAPDMAGGAAPLPAMAKSSAPGRMTAAPVKARVEPMAQLSAPSSVQASTQTPPQGVAAGGMAELSDVSELPDGEWQQVATAPQAGAVRTPPDAAAMVESPAEVAVLPAPGGLRPALAPAPETAAPDLSNLPEAARIDLLSRPPATPPFPASTLLPPTRPSADPEAAGRCRSAVGAAQASVLRFLTLAPVVAEQTAWVEDTLRVTELALSLCQGQSAGEGAATYWRATAFLLHGQYARAAVNFRRVADDGGAYAAYDYSRTLADLLEACARSDRAALDAWRTAGLHEAAGRTARAADFYHTATATACRPLRDRARLRLSLLKS